MTTFFTSDQHFDHTNIIKYCNRPFVDTTAMNEHLIMCWNKTVKSDDTIYILGDFVWKLKDILTYTSRLNGHKHIILGGHDDVKILKAPEDYGFESASAYAEIKIDGIAWILFHYPIESWNKLHYDAIHLHGHVHDKNQEYLPLKKNRYNVCVDLNAFTPVSTTYVQIRLQEEDGYIKKI
jgi:calcineurin-like phosphoesterase family protein